MIEAYPLCWPVGYPRTESPVRNTAFYQTSVDKQRKELLRELKLLGATDVIISTNIPLRLDGFPRSGWEQKRIEDKGVAVYFMLDEDQRVLCCDAWDLFEDNFRALVLTVDAMRGLGRWKVSEIMKRTFYGHKELPQETQTFRDIWATLGLSAKPAAMDVVKSAYRRLATQRHPDHPGGSHDAFAELNNAYQAALKFFE